MSTRQLIPSKSAAVTSPSFTPVRSGLLQRKCACGGTPGPSGECEACKKKKRLWLQTKLKVNEPGDIYEQEADRIADKVMGAPAHLAVGSAPLRIQRLSGQLNGQLDAAPASVDQALASPSRPLEPALQQEMERRLGHDFSRVRVHSGGAAEQSAWDVHASAYTVGHQIVFGTGRFTPGTREGRRLLAHELTHVVQQGSAGGTPLIQRQEDSDPETVTKDPTRPPPDFGDIDMEQGCPPTPTNLGKLVPMPQCPRGEREIDGERFHFCTDSDVYATDGESARVRPFARKQRSDAVFNVQGYASIEGDQLSFDYNLNLSCHRAKRVARDLQNAGVPSQQIRLSARGRTGKFGAKREDNRVVVVSATSPARGGEETDVPITPRDIVDAAVTKILARDYRLAADAYVSKWTCGHAPTVADMVRRTQILIEGESANARVERDPMKPGDPRLGHPNVEGLREIVLAKETFSETSDPVGCTAARIVDMAFHHFVSDTLGIGPNDPPVHSAALFLVELAGFVPCETPEQRDPNNPNLVLNPAQWWWTRPTADPLRGRSVKCQDAPLPGPIDPQHQPRSPEVPPNFAAEDLSPDFGESPVRPEIDPPAQIVRVQSPQPAFALRGQATASGDPDVIGHYEIGFLQTVVDDETIADYVGGERLHMALPVPIRDQALGAPAPPPWFSAALVARPDAHGVAQSSMSHSLSMQVPFEFEDLSRRGRKVPVNQAGNILNRAYRKTTYHTWLVARREDAPLDRFSTLFLKGNAVNCSLDVDLVGLDGTARYSTNVDATALTDASPMQLRGPTPAKISQDLSITHVSPPTARDQASGVTPPEMVKQVKDTVDELEPLRRELGLGGELLVRLYFDKTTGRLRITTPERPSVTVAENEKGGIVSGPGRQHLANELLARLRKDLVLAPVEKNDPASFGYPVIIRKLPGNRLFDPKDDPFSAPHGIGLVGKLREEQELERSADQLANDPDTYDPTFWPSVEVKLAHERYCYDFGISGVDIPDFCHESLDTAACVRLDLPTGPADIRMEPEFRPQKLGRDTFNSPIALKVTTTGVGFTLVTPREDPGGYTFTHEMNHLMESYDLVQTLKDRLARQIRGRLMSARAAAAEHPELKRALLSRETIAEIVRQENRSFDVAGQAAQKGPSFFALHFKAQGEELHAREERNKGLPRYQLRPGWHDVIPRRDEKGSFTDNDEGCR